MLTRRSHLHQFLPSHQQWRSEISCPDETYRKSMSLSAVGSPNVIVFCLLFQKGKIIKTAAHAEHCCQHFNQTQKNWPHYSCFVYLNWLLFKNRIDEMYWFWFINHIVLWNPNTSQFSHWFTTHHSSEIWRKPSAGRTMPDPNRVKLLLAVLLLAYWSNCHIKLDVLQLFL